MRCKGLFRVLAGVCPMVLFAMLGFQVQAAVIDLAGTDFTFAAMPSYVQEQASLWITPQFATGTATAVVRWPAGAPTLFDTIAITAGVPASHQLPLAASGWTPGTGKNAVEVHCDKSISCVIVNGADTAAGAASVLPHDALGQTYWLTTFDALFTAGVDAGQFAVIATENLTNVTITSSQNLSTGQLANAPFMVALNQGDAFFGRSASTVGGSANLTGTYIVANKPVAVLQGNVCTQVPMGTGFCNAMIECAWPVERWDSTYLIVPPSDSVATSAYYTLQASQSGTLLSYDPALPGAPASLSVGGFAVTAAVSSSHHITANKPIQVTQWVSATGILSRKPEMVEMPGSAQYAENHTFVMAASSLTDRFYCTVITESAAAATITLDGTPIGTGKFSSIGSSGFSFARLATTSGLHTTSSPGHVHCVILYPMNRDWHTYAYQAGVLFANTCPITTTGDVNVNGSITSSDIIGVVNYVFKGGTAPLPCTAAGDVNCSGTVTSADIIALVNFVFKGGPAPCDGCTSPLAGSCS